MLRALRKLFGRHAETRNGEGGMVARFKAHIAGEGLETNVLAPDDAAMAEFEGAGALSPPLPFDQLLTLFFTSNALRQNIDAMATNVDGFGWRPVSTLPGLMGPNRAKVVKEFEAMRGRALSDDEAQKLADEWKQIAERERHRLVHFFEFINHDDTFTDLRKKTRQDRETLGNGAWEWQRNREQMLRVATYIPFVTVRLCPLDKQSTPVEVPHKTDPVTIEHVTIKKRFRKFIQVQEQVAVYFKEFGDPRVMSSKTGAVYKTPADLEREEPGVRAATELLHFKIHAPNEAYGMPRWTGTLPEVIGSRLAAEVNVLYFENKSVPPLMMFVSGGRVASDSVGKIESFIRNNIKGGGENYHNILIIEAEAEGEGKAAGNAKITVKPLTEAINQDALFQKYDRNNIDKVGASFRIPGMLRGDSKELNRSTAEVAKSLAEEQVFQPEREDFDAVMNRKVLPALGIRFWEFKTKAPITRDPDTLSKIVARLTENAVMTPGEAREFVPEVLGRELDHIDEDFLKRPLRMTLALIRAQNVPGAPGVNEGDAPQGLAAGAAEGLESDLKRLYPLASDAVKVRQLIEAIEMRGDLGGISADELRRLVDGDGSSDPETNSDSAPTA